MYCFKGNSTVSFSVPFETVHVVSLCEEHTKATLRPLFKSILLSTLLPVFQQPSECHLVFGPVVQSHFQGGVFLGNYT